MCITERLAVIKGTLLRVETNSKSGFIMDLVVAERLRLGPPTSLKLSEIDPASISQSLLLRNH